MFCNKCGNEIPTDSTFCVKCGAKLETAQPIQNYSQPIEEKINVGLVILSVMLPLVGIILGIVYLVNQNKRAGKAYLIAAIACVLLQICIYSAIIAPIMIQYSSY